VNIEDYLKRVIDGASEAAFIEEFAHPVLIELEGQEGGGGEVAMTERLDSHAIRLQSRSSREASVFTLTPSTPGEPIRVGRNPESEVLVDHKSVSKGHAEFRVGDDGGLQLTDLGSTNGTFVNNRQLESGKAANVMPDDTVRFGRATGFYVLDARGFYQYLLTLQRFGF
jgi:hypothetical protein